MVAGEHMHATALLGLAYHEARLGHFYLVIAVVTPGSEPPR